MCSTDNHTTEMEPRSSNENRAGAAAAFHSDLRPTTDPAASASAGMTHQTEKQPCRCAAAARAGSASDPRGRVMLAGVRRKSAEIGQLAGAAAGRRAAAREKSRYWRVPTSRFVNNATLGTIISYTFLAVSQKIRKLEKYGVELCGDDGRGRHRRVRVLPVAHVASENRQGTAVRVRASAAIFGQYFSQRNGGNDIDTFAAERS